MHRVSIFPLLLMACGQDVTTSPADCGAGSPSEDAASIGREDARVTMIPDSGSTTTDAASDAGMDAGSLDASAPLACHVDPFSSCADPGETNSNNEPSDPTYRTFTGGNGCRSSDEFTAGTDMLGGKVCHTEPADWFEYTYLPCDTITFIAELRVRVTTPCERDAWSLTVSNFPCDGTDPDVQCTWEGEWRVVRALIRPASTIGLFKFGLSQPGNATAFEYEATFELRR